MTQSNNVPVQPARSVLPGKRMALGAGIGLAVILLFIVPAGAGNPAWGRLWMIRPLIVVPLAGACGGAFYHFMRHLTNRGSWKRVAANVLSFIVFIVGLWLGIVLGMAGTLWH